MAVSDACLPPAVPPRGPSRIHLSSAWREAMASTGAAAFRTPTAGAVKTTARGPAEYPFRLAPSAWLSGLAARAGKKHMVRIVLADVVSKKKDRCD
jgi:hypothetical protein